MWELIKNQINKYLLNISMNISKLTIKTGSDPVTQYNSVHSINISNFKQVNNWCEKIGTDDPK